MNYDLTKRRELITKIRELVGEIEKKINDPDNDLSYSELTRIMKEAGFYKGYSKSNVNEKIVKYREEFSESEIKSAKPRALENVLKWIKPILDILESNIVKYTDEQFDLEIEKAIEPIFSSSLILYMKIGSEHCISRMAFSIYNNQTVIASVRNRKYSGTQEILDNNTLIRLNDAYGDNIIISFAHNQSYQRMICSVIQVKNSGISNSFGILHGGSLMFNSLRSVFFFNSYESIPEKDFQLVLESIACYDTLPILNNFLISNSKTTIKAINPREKQKSTNLYLPKRVNIFDNNDDENNITEKVKKHLSKERKNKKGDIYLNF